MSKLVKVIFLFSIVTLIGCKKFWQETNARDHADKIMNHLHEDSVIALFPEKNFKKESTQNLLTNLQRKCHKLSRKGGFRDKSYTFNVQGKDFVEFIYDYKYDCGYFRFTLTYDITWSKNELRSFFISDLPDSLNLPVPSPSRF